MATPSALKANANNRQLPRLYTARAARDRQPVLESSTPFLSAGFTLSAVTNGIFGMRATATAENPACIWTQQPVPIED